MTITYPLSFPDHTGIRSIELRATNAVAYSRSPFTFAGQAFAYPGQMWQADVSLPPMKREDAEVWIAWLISLRGQFGTFTMGDPIGATPRGTAIASRVNLFDYTEQFDNAYWTKAQSSATANSVVSPDGLTTAETLIEDSVASTAHRFNRSMSFVSGVTYTFSVYVKSQSSRNISLLLPNSRFGGVNTDAVFSSSNGSVLWTASGTATASASVGSGWFRVAITKTCSSTGSGIASIGLASGTSVTYLGDGASGAYVWGAQLEVGSAPTTYQPIYLGYGPYVNGASQTGDTLVIDGASPSETGYLLPGDYVQLGSGSTATLHKVLNQVDTDASGNATLTLWPHIRTAPADNATVTVSNAVGRWRLAANESSWNVNEASIYGINFTAMEAV